jgi:hypothetical protein
MVTLDVRRPAVISRPDDESARGISRSAEAKILESGDDAQR